MAEERKPLWPWIVGLLIGLPILYVLSHGPWWLILTHHHPPQFVYRIGQAFYSPIWSSYYAGAISENAFSVFMDYNSWWASLVGDPPSTIQPTL